VSTTITMRKIQELRIIREFLRFRGFRSFRLKPQEKPDAIATLPIKGKHHRIGIELIEYHVDAPPSIASQGREIHRVWQAIQTSINRRISHRPDLMHTTGWVCLKTSNLSKKPKAQQLAAELVKLALEFLGTFISKQTITTFSSSTYPLLQAHVRKVILFRTDVARNVGWACADADSSPIGLSENYITSIIQRKGLKNRKYNWNQSNERWLLITASGSTVFNSAGRYIENINWSSPNFKSACQSAGFDRILFWDRMYNWYKELRPGAPVVQKKWQG